MSRGTIWLLIIVATTVAIWAFSYSSDIEQPGADVENPSDIN